MRIWKPTVRGGISNALGGLLVVMLALTSARTAQAQVLDPDATAQIIKADLEFAQAVAQRNREKFLSFIADTTTFSGGTPNELHGRDAVMKAWAEFFEPDGPALSWTPTKGEVIGAGDVGYTIGRSIYRSKVGGRVTERRGEYLTVWKKQSDGSWQAIFDTGSTLP